MTLFIHSPLTLSHCVTHSLTLDQERGWISHWVSSDGAAWMRGKRRRDQNKLSSDLSLNRIPATGLALTLWVESLPLRWVSHWVLQHQNSSALTLFSASWLSCLLRLWWTHSVRSLWRSAFSLLSLLFAPIFTSCDLFFLIGSISISEQVYCSFHKKLNEEFHCLKTFASCFPPQYFYERNEGIINSINFN